MPDKDKRYLYPIILIAGSWLLFLFSAILISLNFNFSFVLSFFFWCLFFSLNLIAIIYGIFLLFRHLSLIEKSFFKILALLVSVLFLGLFIIFGYISLTFISTIPSEDLCRSNLNGLGQIMKLYSDEFNRYPAKEKWCDMLIQKEGISLKFFKCPNDKKGPSSYALNPNAEPNSPGNIVLIFEAKPGWNQYGGKELLNPDNHKGTSSNILFKNGRVEFINKKDFWRLNWGVPQSRTKY